MAHERIRLDIYDPDTHWPALPMMKEFNAL